MKRSLLLLLPALLAACTVVDPTEVGLKISKAGTSRGITRANVVSGYVTYFPPTTEVVTYPINLQTYTWSTPKPDQPVDESFSFQTADQITLNADVSFSYQVEPDKAPEIYKTFGRDIDRITRVNIHNIVRDIIASRSSEFRADQILGGDRTKFEAAALAGIKEVLEPSGFLVRSFGFVGEIRPPKSVRASIAAKFEAQQTAIRAQNKVVQAKAEADQAIEKARGDAQAILLRAEAQARANKILASSLTPDLVKMKQIERWNGVSPRVTGGGDGLILNLGDEK